jgi:hypothetical protein
MPSHTSTFFTRLSSKVSNLLQKRQNSPADNLPITRSSLAFHREQGRKLQRDEANGLYAQAQRGIEAVPASVIVATSVAGDNDEEWSWCNSGEGQLSGDEEQVSDRDQSAESERENWRHDWEPIMTMLKEGAQRRAVVATFDRRESEEKHDSGSCDYNYLAALKALEESETGGECGIDCRAQAFVDAAMERFKEAKRKMRRMVLSTDPGSIRRREGTVACGDWPIDVMMMAAGGSQR